MVAQDGDGSQPKPDDPQSTPQPDSPHHESHGLGGGWIALIVLLLLAALVAGYIFYINYRARRKGLPTPGLNILAPFRDSDHVPSRNYPARGGVRGWLDSQLRNLKNKRTAGGAYEGASLADNPGPGGGGRRRGFGRLDPDEAWDARVDSEADAYDSGPYYGEGTELRDQDAMFGGARSYTADVERGRSRERASLDRRYEEETGMAPPSRSRQDPFSDHAEPSGLRGVSPRPHEESPQRYQNKTSLGVDDSPTERKSIFREADM